MSTTALNQLHRLQDSVNNWSAWKFVALYLAYTILAMLAVVARYGFDPASLVHFGHYYIEQNKKWTPDGAVRFIGNEENGGNGYDGQIFYYYARTLFSPGQWPDGFSKSYRAPRVGYPLLVAPFSLLGSTATIYGMILIQLALGTGVILSLKSLLARRRRYLILFYILSPFLLQSSLLLVSDSIAASLVVIGYRNYTKIKSEEGVSHKDALLMIIWFSLAILTKESALFLLFPIGLHAVARRDIRNILYILATLLPAIIWQLYLTGVHGILPAGKLQIFLSPFSGLIGLYHESFSLIADSFSRGQYLNGAILKLSARWMLALLIPVSLLAIFQKKPTALRMWPWGVGMLLILTSTIMADHYYFWGVYENISRMFTLLVPAIILMKDRDEDASILPFLALIALMAIMVYGRTLFLTPTFPYDQYHPYSGPSYRGHAPLP